jgi:hypothetical protein
MTDKTELLAIKEVLAKILRPKLWSEEPWVAHMEASPMDLEYCRDAERKRIDNILDALTKAGYELRTLAAREVGDVADLLADHVELNMSNYRCD